ncbi:GM24133 [Drosophila sechellia]|uniref:GM24133 n=1 Tax=Drosophila sechellia TaxID=7238 RepID=B4INN9_DROSE|nr:GM24133 [Drosophila sechellia]
MSLRAKKRPSVCTEYRSGVFLQNPITTAYRYCKTMPCLQLQAAHTMNVALPFTVISIFIQWKSRSLSTLADIVIDLDNTIVYLLDAYSLLGL